MIELLLAFVAGLLAGSFLNVCIHRWPADLSVVWPGSRCPRCSHPIAWYDNVPLVSYFLLGARCRHCRGAISYRYPLVEAITALAFAAGVLRAGLQPSALVFAVLAALQVGLIFSDIETRLLPDQFTLGGLGLGLAFALLLPSPALLVPLLAPDLPPRAASLVESALAAALAAALLWSAGWLYTRLRHREGLGLGDVKMIAMIGAFLGFQGVFLTVFLGCLAGSALGLAYIWFTRKDASTYPLPFGAFLGAAAVVVAWTRL